MCCRLEQPPLVVSGEMPTNVHSKTKTVEMLERSFQIGNRCRQVSEIYLSRSLTWPFHHISTNV